MPPFEVVSDFDPAGDQPEAISALAKGLRSGKRHQTLLGITGSGKSFTIANVIAEVTVMVASREFAELIKEPTASRELRRRQAERHHAALAGRER